MLLPQAEPVCFEVLLRRTRTGSFPAFFSRKAIVISEWIKCRLLNQLRRDRLQQSPAVPTASQTSSYFAGTDGFVTSEPLHLSVRRHRMQRFDKPGNSFAEVLHIIESFFVALHLSLLPADAKIPISRARNDHLRHQEHVVD